MQFLRELVSHPAAEQPAAAAGAGPAPDRPVTPTPPAAASAENDLREENRLLRDQLRELTLSTAAAQKAAAESAADVDYWKAEALKAVMRPASTAVAPGAVEEAAALREEVQALQARLEAAKAESATKARDAQAVYAKDRAEVQRELERSEAEAKEAKEENERLRRMSEELFARIESLETQLNAAAERLRVESTRGDEARAQDKRVQAAFGLAADESVELTAGASDAQGRRGELYVTTAHVCFEVLPLLKLLNDVRVKLAIRDIASLDRVPGLFGRGSALAIAMRDGSVVRFIGLFNRRDIVQAILKVAEKFRPIEIHLLRNGRDHTEAARQATVAASLGLDRISAESPPPASFTAYVKCPFLALFLQCSTSGRLFGDAKKTPAGLWEVTVRDGRELSLRSTYNGMYVCSERPLPLLPLRFGASREKAGKWETFAIVWGPSPGLFALRTCHGQYIAAAADGSFSVVPVNGKAPTHTELLSFSTN